MRKPARPSTRRQKPMPVIASPSRYSAVLSGPVVPQTAPAPSANRYPARRVALPAYAVRGLATARKLKRARCCRQRAELPTDGHNPGFGPSIRIPELPPQPPVGLALRSGSQPVDDTPQGGTRLELDDVSDDVSPAAAASRAPTDRPPPCGEGPFACVIG